jgi:hypothetical protein
MSRFPAVFRLPTFASRPSDSRRGLGPPYGRLTGSKIRTPTGLPRSTRTSYDRGRCLLYPEDGDARPAGPSSPAGACRFSTASPCTPLRHPIGGASDNEASTEVHAIHPSGHSPRLWPRMERRLWASSLSFGPRRPGANDARQGGDGPEHKPETTLTTSAEPPICVSTRKRATSSRNEGL